MIETSSWILSQTKVTKLIIIFPYKSHEMTYSPRTDCFMCRKSDMSKHCLLHPSMWSHKTLPNHLWLVYLSRRVDGSHGSV